MAMENGPWAAYQPSPKDPWGLRKVAHLHRRAAFGATRAEMERDRKDGPLASLGRLFKPREMTAEERQVLDSLRQGVLDSADADRLKAWWLYRVLFGPDPLREKMVLFWHGHFATSNRKVSSVPMMLAQNELLRQHALGPFADLLSAIVSDAAMLVWLDGGESKKEKPNENFAREVMELFTLGVGHYTEKDIREAARAFTGWAVEESKGRFAEARHDVGVKTVLGQSGKWRHADVVRIILEQPACAEFLCRRLYRFFVNEAAEPAAELIALLAAQLRRTNYDVGALVRTILLSNHFYDSANLRQRIKSPVEHGAGLLRALEVPRGEVRLLALSLACERQGQDLFHPPTVKGWDGGRAWLNSTTVLERSNWCSDVVWGNADYGLRPYDPLAWARRYGLAPNRTAEAMLELLLQGGLSDRARELVLAPGRDGSPDGLRKSMQRILSCPEYQLA